jgi:hypothetical protein
MTYIVLKWLFEPNFVEYRLESASQDRMHTMHLPRPSLLPLITSVIGLLILGSVLIGLEAPLSLGDGIRHITFASQLFEHGVQHIGGWGDVLFSGYFSVRNIDPWFLTHVLLIPLTVMEVVPAQYLFALLQIALLCSVTVMIFRSLKLSPQVQSALLGVLLFGNIQFTLRLLLGRPLLITVALCILVLAAVLKRKAITVGILLALATLLSHMFPFPVFIAVCGCVWLVSISENKAALQLAMYSVIGVAIGIALHPQSLSYVHYMLTVFLREPFLTPIHNATEMQSGLTRMGAMAAVTGLAVLLAHYARMVGDVSWREMHDKGVSLTAGIVLFMLLCMLLWTRMMDFLWPLQIVLLGQILSLRPYLMRDIATALLPSFALKRGTIVLLTLLILGVHTAKLHHSFRTTDAKRLLTHFSTPLQNIPAGSRILNTDWDIFPALFTVRPDLLFTRGMSPSYDYVLSPKSIALTYTRKCRVEKQHERTTHYVPGRVYGYMDSKKYCNNGGTSLFGHSGRIRQKF